MRDAKTRHGRYTEEHRNLMRLIRALDAATKRTLGGL